MSVSSTVQKIIYVGNGSSTVFAIPSTIPYYAASEIEVYLRNETVSPATESLLSSPGQYAVSGAVQSGTQLIGGNVTMVTAPTSTQKLLIRRIMPLTQTSSYTDNGPFSSSTLMQNLDWLTMATQQLQEEVTRRPRFKKSSPTANVDLPEPVANQYLAWSSDALSVVNQTAVQIVTAAGALLALNNLSDLTSPGTARSNLGLGSAALASTSAFEPANANIQAHIANLSNPHSVTASQVGNTTAQWNANQIQGTPVNASAALEGRVLIYRSGTLVYEAPGAASAAAVAFTPTGSLTSTTVQNALAELDTKKVAKAGDTMTGALAVAGSSDAKQLIVKANATQTNNLQEWQNSSGTPVASMSSAGVLSASLSGNVTGNVTGNVSGTSASFTGNLTGDVTSSGMATTVALVGGSSAANVNTATALVNGVQSGNKHLASPANGSSGAPSFRALVGADLPNPSASTLGGIQSAAAVSHQWINSISTSGVPSLSQPAFTDISGSVAASQLPNPSATTLGGVQSAAAVSHQWISSISTLGVPSLSQPAFTDISGSVAASQMPALTGDVTTSAGAVATTIAGNAVTNAKLATMAAHTYKGNNTASTGAVLDLTQTQLTAELNQFTSSLQGVVPGSGGGTSNFLRADGTWAIPAPSVALLNVAAKTGAFTLTTANDVVTASGAALTLTLPTAVGNTGKVFYLKKTDSSSTNIITIATTSSQTIDGVTTYALRSQYESITVVSDGSNWSIV